MVDLSRRIFKLKVLVIAGDDQDKHKPECIECHVQWNRGSKAKNRFRLLVKKPTHFFCFLLCWNRIRYVIVSVCIFPEMGDIS